MALPRTIWTMWQQGYDQAPEIALASHASWRRFNPTWQVHALSEATLADHLPREDLSRILGTPKPYEAVSDEVRIELLHRHGGVWADATTICAKPLDEWLPEHATSGFFAFEKPADDRMIASWFLAATPGNHIVSAWRNAVVSYWRGRTERDDYFWFHHLFGDLYESDQRFRDVWDGTPKLPAKHTFHFGSDDTAILMAPPTAEYSSGLSKPPSPVFKLTHKAVVQHGSLFEALCRFAHGA